MDNIALFKAMWASPRLPKPWEAAYADWQEFQAWAAKIPETTPQALWPLMWPVRGEMQYQDGGGLNNLLKERGLTKKAWKAIQGLPLEDAIELFSFHRRLGLSRWVMDLPAAVDAARTSAVPVSAPLLTILMGLRLEMEGLNDPYLTDRINFVRMISRHLESEIPANLEAFRADLQQMLDFLDDEGYNFAESTTVPELKEASDAWHEEMAAEARQGQPVAANETEATWRVAPTPGGRNEFQDASTGLQVVRLHRFVEFQRESQLMNHCIGSSDTYHSKHRNGVGAFYSMRQEGQERPVATLELVCHNGEWRIAQCRGPSNRDPGREANDLAQRLLDGHRNGEIREASYEFVYGGDRSMSMLSNTNSRYF
ncbi:PcfJ domain-containing protein [Geopseudomonas aromaticivorans]